MDRRIEDLLFDGFTRSFGKPAEPRFFFSPGRVNLIGEHLDYNGGHVFPAAISVGLYALVEYNNNNSIRLVSHGFDQESVIPLDKSRISRDNFSGWSLYPAGVVLLLLQRGQKLPGADIYIYSNLPADSGLSSSAALEILTGHILTRGGLEREEDLVDLALLSQKAENEFVGVNCGIMDQFSIALSKEGSALLLDTRTLEYRPVPLDLSPWRLTVMDTASPRSLAGSAFNERRDESARALEIIASRRSLDYLAGAREDDLDLIEDEILRRRARHVITEEKRVMEAVSALEKGDLKTFGELLNRSHLSLRDDYEVTGPDLDSLVDSAREREECLGARMTGAGFGGCAIALVHEDAVYDFRDSVKERYMKERNREAKIFDVRAGSPAGEFEKGVME